MDDQISAIPLQASGRLTVMCMRKGLQFNTKPGTYPWLSVTMAKIVYGPPNEPPPEWTAGKQYYTALPAECPTYEWPVTYTGSVSPYGGLLCLSFSDLSNNTVLPGKTYRFIVQAFQLIRIFVELDGQTGGTMVQAGFGLYSLPGNPHAYTYISPTDFDGEWQIGLLSPLSQSIMWLAMEYAPPKDYGSGSLESRLTFKLEGAVGWWGNVSAQGQSEALPVAEGPMYLYKAGDYRTHKFD